METSRADFSGNSVRAERSTARSTLAVLIGSMVFATAVGLTAASGATGSPPTGKIIARFPGPPTTFYDAQITDPDTPADKLTFTWEVSIGCGSWQLATRQSGPPANNGVDWWHGEAENPGDPIDGPLANKSGVACNHTDYGNHLGTFTVTVTDDTGNGTRCTITGHQDQPNGVACQPFTPTPSSASPSTSDASVDLCLRIIATPVDAAPADAAPAIRDTCTGEDQGTAKVESGERVSYRYRVTNLGPAPASGVVLKDHMIFNVLDRGACKFLSDTDTVACQLGVVNPDEPISRTVVVRAETGDEKAFFYDNARVSTSSFDRNSENNRGRVAVAVLPVLADVSVTLRSVASIGSGDRFTAIAVVKNAGPRIAESVKLEGGAIGATVVAAKGCSPRGNDFTCSLGSMFKGETIKKHVTFKDKSDIGGEIDLDAEVTSDTADPNKKNNKDRATTQVR